MASPYDCIVVGARCAGAPLARFLALGGARVLLVDRASFPSDQPLSTHFIQPYGMRILDELELGDQVREIAPPVTQFAHGIDDQVARLRLPMGGCCPRRIDLDALLVDGARAAGAEVRERTRVIDLLRDGDRVVGVVLEDDSGRHQVRADVVVGADGRDSFIARQVGAEEYYAYTGPRAAYWAYFPRPSWYGDDERFQGAAFIHHSASNVRFIFPTNQDQLLIGAAFPRDEVPAWRADPDAKLRQRLERGAFTAPLVDGVEPISKVIGLVKLRYFFRRAAGPGWALVGDAGLHKDPTPGLGITDALRDARALSRAILGGGGDDALEGYWRQRDVDSVELFHFAKDLGEPGYNNPLNYTLFSKLATRPELRECLIEVVERRISPFEAFTTGQVLRWTLGALLRGKLGVLKAFLTAGKYGGMVKREARLRRELLVPTLPCDPGPSMARGQELD